jgi:thiol-disulfide isomerase/thioredoxin
MTTSRRRFLATAAMTMAGTDLLHRLALPIGAGAAGGMPAFTVERWVNSAPLTADLLRGKVVLVDFWEYTCINWIRTSPYLRAWHRDYAGHGLVVVGVHAPEFEFGKRAENIDRGIRAHGLTYPIALDNDFATWRAFANDAWPAKYLFDAHGTLAKRWVGEGRYGDIEAEIRRRLVAASPGATLPPISPRRRRSRRCASLRTPASRARRTSAPTAASRARSPWKVSGRPHASTSSSRAARASSSFPSRPARSTW